MYVCVHLAAISYDQIAIFTHTHTYTLMFVETKLKFNENANYFEIVNGLHLKSFWHMENDGMTSTFLQ